MSRRLIAHASSFIDMITDMLDFRFSAAFLMVLRGNSL
jgi:hypothetical protein